MFAMLFTLIVWVIAFVRLVVAVILWFFLFNHIPSADGSLKKYCRRKINVRLKEVVRQKVNNALDKGLPLVERNPTQPDLDAVEANPTVPTLPFVGINDAKFPSVGVSRTATGDGFNSHSHPAPDMDSSLQRDPALPDLAMPEDRAPLTRTVTEASAYSETAPLSANAADMGYSPVEDDRSFSSAPVPPLRKGTPGRFNTPPLPNMFNSEARYTPVLPSPLDRSGGRSPATQSPKPPGTYPPPLMSRPGTPSDRPFSPAGQPLPPSLTPRPSNGAAYPGRPLTPANRTFSPRPQFVPDPGLPGNRPMRPFTPGADRPSYGLPFEQPPRGPRVQSPRPESPRVQSPRPQSPRVQTPRPQSPRDPPGHPNSIRQNGGALPPFRPYSPRVNSPAQPPPGGTWM